MSVEMSKDISKPEQLITEHIDIWTSAILAKSTSGRGSSKKYELYGITKLRELILELAVRGKLVPQDANDEPASVLLEKIAAEKAELIKDKKIKKNKPLLAINDEEKSFNLPKGWEWCKLGNIASYGNPSKAESNTVQSDTWILELEDIEKGTSRLLEKVRFSERQFKSTKNVFSKDDVLYGKLRPYLDKVVVADESGVCTTEIIPITCHDNLLPYYLRYFLKSPSFIKYANGSTHGMSLPRLGTDKAINSIVSLPPTNEQQRIVAKVDELMLLCDQLEQQTEASIEAHATLVEVLLATLTDSGNADELAQNWARIAEHFDSLFTTEQSIEALKQTVLQLAVMGKLVPQNPEDEPASVLLEKIAEEKERLIEEKKIKKEKPLPPISDGEKFFELPKGWEWCQIDSLSLSSEAGWSPKCDPTPKEGDNWGVLKVSAVTWGKYQPDENKALPNYLEPKPQYEVKANDFLISRANTADLVARSVVVPKNTPEKLMMSDKIIRFSFTKDVFSYYINLVNNSSYSREYYAEVAGGTSSSMKNVSRSQVRALKIALPPLAEQHRIVAKVDELMAICDQLKVKLQQSQETQVQLTDALIDRALG
ncbi:restriction endonuclease subunit S [Psychrobacter sp. 219-2-C]|uniref:restriction endonuclease subunit S n=1 Tax=Psychrobacter sp. 219-2-C TaxID=3414707 RepID=UPI003C6DD548